jgi:hypothetical protein
MKNFFVKGFIPVLLAIFVSCNDDDPSPYGYGDAYVASELSEGTEEPVVVYGLHMDASAIYGTLSSVEVTAGSESYTLVKNTDTGAFYFESDEYTTDPPAEGTYIFTYTFSSGETSTSSDVLSDDVLLPANITSCVFSDDEIELEWDEIEDAEAVEIRLKEADGDLIFRSTTNSSGYLAGDKTDYTISSSAGTWKDGYSMTDGDTYIVEVIGLLGDGTNYLQAQSTATTTIVWGE